MAKNKRKKKILVVLKQVPGKKEKGGYRDTEFLNQSDKNVLEEVLNLSDDIGAETDVMILGPKSAENILQEALAYGIHEAILVTNEEDGNHMIGEIGEAVVFVAEKYGAYDLIFCGRQSIDGDSAYVAAMIAENFSIPLIPYAKKTWIEGERVLSICSGNRKDEQIRCEMPAMILSVREKNQSRYPTAAHIMRAYSGEYKLKIIKMKSQEEQNIKIVQTRKYEIEGMGKKHVVVFSGKDADAASDKLIKIIKEWDVL